MAGERADHFMERIKSEQRCKASGSGAASGSAAGNEQDNGTDQNKNEDDSMITIRLRENSKFQKQSVWKFKRNETMLAHLHNYANSIQANFDNLRFVTHDGSRINRTDTPESLELKDDEVVDVLQW
ncbi:ubiquitin-like protein [Apiospora phragmitis]|uniref:Ubiquitin-like protein n=1 Tax=Apiospora phragmitis TaxID=2905665 RepID=A0ABR1V0E4_9PEZI